MTYDVETIKRGLPERIRDTRKSHGLSMNKFGEAIGATSSNVSDWENGKYLPGLLAVLSISQQFKVSLNWLLTGEEREENHIVSFEQSIKRYDLKTFGQRIRKLRKEKGITLEDIEAVTGISNSNLSKIERNKINPSLESAVLISDCLKQSLDYLVKGVAQCNQLDQETKTLIEAFNLLDKDNRNSIKSYIAFLLSSGLEHDDLLAYALTNNKTTTPTPKKEIVKEERGGYFAPILGQAAAGLPILAEELFDGLIPVTQKNAKDKAYFIRIKGDSMIGAGINDGDLVLIRPQPVAETGEIALVKYNGDAAVKRFYHEGTFVRLKSANPNYDDIIINNLESFKILGKVVKTIPKEEANRLTKPLFE